MVKIDPADLPQRPNIHYLGGKRYDELPAYLAGWDVGFMPFAINESTRFISPTKTPEYLAAGRPVVSTPDHGRGPPPTARAASSAIAATPAETVAALEATLAEAGAREAWLAAGRPPPGAHVLGSDLGADDGPDPMMRQIDSATVCRTARRRLAARVAPPRGRGRPERPVVFD